MRDKYHIDDDNDYSLSTCSSMECTGLIPALPQSEDELEAYQDLYEYQKVPVKNNSKDK